jgi:uncharacterized RDD family membrane protein YckC
MDEARPAGFWIRAVAALADFAIFFLVQVSFGSVAATTVGPNVEDLDAFLPLVWTFTLVFAGTYTTVLHARGSGQTIGKLLVGVRVTSVDGGLLPVGAALLRFVGYFASLASFAVGFAMAGLRRDKRALHDLLASSRVEYVARVLGPAPSPEAAPPRTTE